MGFRYQPKIEGDDPEARHALVLMAPRAIGLGATQITFIVVTSLATLLGAGAVSDFNFAFVLLQIPLGVIGVPLGHRACCRRCRARRRSGTRPAFASLLTRALRLLIYVMVPISVLTAVARQPFVEILFGSGKISQENLDLIALTLGWFLIGLTAHALIAVLARAFYARQDTVTPVVAAVAAVAINTTLAIILVGPLGLAGLALAIAIAAWIEALALIVVLRRRLPVFPLAGMGRVSLEALGGSVVAGAAAYVVLQAAASWLGPDPGRLLQLVAVARRRGRLRARLCRGLARLADPRTADYRRSHGRRPPPPQTSVTPSTSDPSERPCHGSRGLGCVRRLQRSGLLPAVGRLGGRQGGQWLGRDPIERRAARRPDRRPDPAAAPERHAVGVRLRAAWPGRHGVDAGQSRRPSPITSGTTCRAGRGASPPCASIPRSRSTGPRMPMVPYGAR